MKEMKSCPLDIVTPRIFAVRKPCVCVFTLRHTHAQAFCRGVYTPIRTEWFAIRVFTPRHMLEIPYIRYAKYLKYRIYATLKKIPFIRD